MSKTDINAQDTQNKMKRWVDAAQAKGTFTDMVDALAHDVSMQRLEPELGTSGRQWLNDARHIVANEDEARHIGVSFHGASQSILRILQETTAKSKPIKAASTAAELDTAPILSCGATQRHAISGFRPRRYNRDW